ncbi:hypothetical protein PA10_00240 [Pseudomonas phage pPa_SNUABM_DT01]|nr:hypothetical protein PA10_00240 [Pseudomonas phage pPa_SNUABM_DT01]
MGGNALAPFGARRVDAKTAKAVTRKMFDVMSAIAVKHGLVLNMHLIPAYRTKPDFGDLDFVVDSRFMQGIDRTTLLAELKEHFNADIPFNNGGTVLSVGVPLEEGGCLQVDLIWTAEENINTSLAYFAWNDLGNLMGRIAHKFGLKYGHDGLWIVLRDGTYEFGKILITRDTAEALTFMGYDPVRWLEGFETRDDIYRFTASTRFFNKAIFELDNRNHTARVREKKRPVYMEFLEWVKNPPFELAEYEFPADKSLNLPRLFEVFPHVKPIYEKEWAKLEEQKYLKTRFNASLVKEITGREDRALGDYMKHFKANHWSALADIRNMSDDQVRDLIVRVEKELTEMA